MELSWRAERRVAAGALVVVGAGVVVAALALPAQGTGWRDHLVPALCPVVLLAGAGAAVLRARAGLAATACLAIGVWALVAAMLAGVDAGRGGGELVVGAGLGLAGAVLVGVGARLLWCSRRRGGRWLVRRVGIGLVAALVGVWVVLPVSIALVVTHRPRGDHAAASLGRHGIEVRLRAADGPLLDATYVPSRNGAAVLVLPERGGTAAHARMLVRHGYGVLALDVRGYGRSGGDPNALGWTVGPDVDAAVAYLQARPDVRGGRIAGLGLSVGGEALLEAAATNRGLRAIVADGAGERSIRESATRGPSAALVLPLQAVQTAAVAILAGAMPPPGLQDLVPRIAPRPVLLVLAGRGGGGEELGRLYAERGGPTVRLWEIPEAQHVGGLQARPGAYERTVVRFLGEALAVGSG